MLKIWSLKQQQEKEQEEARKTGDNGGTAPAAGPRKKKVTAANLRVQKDLTELSLPNTMSTKFADPDNIMNFELILAPDEGMYQGGHFHFNFAINSNFPHEPPKVKCLEKIYHPNIDIQGNICLNILREDWKPVLSLNSIIIGLQYLFLEPNPSDPLNKEAAADLLKDKNAFQRAVKIAMNGGVIHGERFDYVL